MADEFVESRISPEVERFLRAARAGDVNVCKASLTEDPQLIDSVEGGGFGALHFAAFNGNEQLMELLVSFKPNLNIQNYDGNTPLMLAAKMKQNDAIRRLVEWGADANFAGKGGVTAAHHAASMGNVGTLKLLVGLGANLNHTVASPAGSVLHWACHSGDIATVGACIHDFGMSVNSPDEHGGTPLFVACHTKKSDVVTFLLEQGANPNQAAADKSTPLHIAAEFGSLDDVKTLIAFGANPNAALDDGTTPSALAEKAGNRESVRELAKPVVAAAKRLEDAARLKAHGNKVFGEGENVKASRFYTLAIANEPTNHVYFSNRSACYFNMKQYIAAQYDAKRCIALNPKWAKGYFRLAATLNAIKQYDEAKSAIAAGLQLDANNADLKALQDEMTKAGR